MILKLKSVFMYLLLLKIALARIHKLSLINDFRHYVDLTTFGFYQGGILEVCMINFVLPTGPVQGQYGFTLDRTVNDAVTPYLETHTDTCFLKESENSIISPQHPAIIFLRMDFENLKLSISCRGGVNALHLYSNKSQIPIERAKRQSQYMFVNRKKRSNSNDLVHKPNSTSDFTQQCSNAMLPMTKFSSNGYDYYNASFALYIAFDMEEGLYNLYFHNCPNMSKPPPMNFLMEIYETNLGNFLSAGEMPLPALYSMMSLIFFLSAGFWTFLLKTSKHKVFMIHIIMCVLVYLKALSLAFHGINYHFIQTRGEHVTAWAILFYITHLLKGAVLFVTIVLVGTGWNFIKNILSDRDKKLFMIVIPLQVVANVAEIIIEESETGAAEHNAWRDIFILVDLLCCGCILFPVVWSIRHLQDSANTDGENSKANQSLRKLKLFRHFYIMIVCYIYFTRIIVYLLKITVPFQYSWIDEMFRELATFVFFVLTGYKFRPAHSTPYDCSDDTEAEVLSEIGVLEGITKVGSRKRGDLQPLIHDHEESD